MTASNSFDFHAIPVPWEQWRKDSLVGVQQKLDDLIAKKQGDQVWQLRTESVLHSIWTSVCGQRGTASTSCQTDPSPARPIHLNAVSHPPDDESCFELSAEADSGHSSRVAENEQSPPAVADAQQHGERDRIFRSEDADSYECAHCEATFTSKATLTSHKIRCCRGRNVVDNSKQSEKVPLHRCTICNKDYSTKDSLQRHQRQHIQTQCQHCSRVFTSASHLRLHTRFHTGNFPFQCVQCGKAYARKDILEMHLLFLHKPLTNVCTYCGKRFARPSNLRKHMAHHGNVDMPFTCTICQQGFGDLSKNVAMSRDIHSVPRAF